MYVNLTANVRKAGAQGVFSIIPFTVDAESAAHDAVLTAWQAQYGKEWELNHLETIEGKPTFNTMK